MSVPTEVAATAAVDLATGSGESDLLSFTAQAEVKHKAKAKLKLRPIFLFMARLSPNEHYFLLEPK